MSRLPTLYERRLISRPSKFDTALHTESVCGGVCVAVCVCVWTAGGREGGSLMSLGLQVAVDNDITVRRAFECTHTPHGARVCVLSSERDVLSCFLTGVSCHVRHIKYGCV